MFSFLQKEIYDLLTGKLIFSCKTVQRPFLLSKIVLVH